GVNEDLAATAVWGTQQVGLFPGAKHDGVFSLWYAKGPGIDRSGDVLKHANAAGTAPNGGVVIAAGDDHAAKSSTLAHQSEYAFMDAMVPVLNPAGVQEILDFGLFGFALSRFSGCWVALKMISETADSSASVDIDPHRISIASPQIEVPVGGLNIRWPDFPLEQEYRLQRHKIYAALAFVRHNRLDRIVLDAPGARFGIVTTGKAHGDVRQALEDLGLDDKELGRLGVRIYKVGMSWPLEPEGVRLFAEGLEEIVVFEEKRAVVENQIREQLYNWQADRRPRIVGKFDENREWLLPANGELTPAMVATVLAARLGPYVTDSVHSARLQDRIKFIRQKEGFLEYLQPSLERAPHFCSGCPHNTSTRVPAGSRATAGIGCHYMAMWMDRETATFTQMGGEGVSWIGQAPFTETTHIFQNLGDGTYYHSGLLAIRAAIAAGVNMTYKILYNDAVAMTGGQPVDGHLSVEMIVEQVAAEGVKRIAIVSDDPDKYANAKVLQGRVSVDDRRDLNRIQTELREESGISVLIYDQTCAAEKRRRRKRGLMEDPARRVVINELVCEGCGDCSAVSNCLAVIPKETEFGRKRAINQSACNKDFSCVEGFCPSFVTVEGAILRKPSPKQIEAAAIAEPVNKVGLTDPYGIVVPGVGGTGVVTISALLGMAAHLDGYAVTTLDQTGLAQKFGAVLSHVRIGKNPQALHAVRIPAGEADLMLGCDLVVAVGKEALSKLDEKRSAAVVNLHEDMPAGFIQDRDLAFPANDMVSTLQAATQPEQSFFVPATRLATALLGDAIASNLLLVGYAYQQGLIPLSGAALERAIELNGVAVKQNLDAFRWGRWAALDLPSVEVVAGAELQDDLAQLSTSIDHVIERRAEFLSAYQDGDYAQAYVEQVERIRQAETKLRPNSCELTELVARNLFKLMAYKDEYEVARLMSGRDFSARLAREFDGRVKLKFHLAPPLISRIDSATGRPRKRVFGGYMLPVFKLLARFKFLRGTLLDPFGLAEERRAERQLIADYNELLGEIVADLTSGRFELARELLRIPEDIRGYGPIKLEAMARASVCRAELLRRWRSPELQRAA
ncbi:MAG: indolepyruvate ferredoxin oxidoreductase family protein, partial [Gammaproteobacteria bacterium]